MTRRTLALFAVILLAAAPTMAPSPSETAPGRPSAPVVENVAAATPRTAETAFSGDMSRTRPAQPSGAPHETARVLLAAGGAPQPATLGWATWYRDPSHPADGLYAAVPSWRFGDERYAVQVCAFEDGRTNCILVTVRDFCACGDRLGERTVIDLSPAAFSALAPLSVGVLRVTVDGLRRPSDRLPETTTEEKP